MESMLNIIDEDDNVIGQRSREEIHREGLLHREIHVYFVTTDRRIILQHRAKDKDTFPDMLDATVGGHVEIGETYLEAAIKETEEETGIRLTADDFILIHKGRRSGFDPATGKINNVIGASYLYVFRGEINDLRAEAGKALGFEARNIEEHGLTESDKIIPYVLEFCTSKLFDYINNHRTLFD